MAQCAFRMRYISLHPTVETPADYRRSGREHRETKNPSHSSLRSDNKAERRARRCRKPKPKPRARTRRRRISWISTPSSTFSTSPPPRYTISRRTRTRLSLPPQIRRPRSLDFPAQSVMICCCCCCCCRCCVDFFFFFKIVKGRGYVEDVRMSNVRLLMGAVIIVIALFAQFYKKKFPENRDFLIGCIGLYPFFSFPILAAVLSRSFGVLRLFDSRESRLNIADLITIECFCWGIFLVLHPRSDF